jgi:hypothetical protein
MEFPKGSGLAADRRSVLEPDVVEPADKGFFGQCALSHIRVAPTKTLRARDALT